MRSLVRVVLSASLLSMTVGALLLTGCSTWHGLGKDIGKVGAGMEGKNTVTVSGTKARQMTVSVPRSVTIQRGQTKVFEVGIERKNFTEGVRVKVSQLPKGVTVDDSSKNVETDAVIFILEAAYSAYLVSDQAVKVTVDGPGDMQSIQVFRLTVKD